MGKWLNLLADAQDDALLQTPSGGADKTANTPLLSVLAVTHEGAFDNSRPDLTDAIAPEPADVARDCADCVHLLRRGTCGEPVAAGLIPSAEGYGIAWPPEGYASTCNAFCTKPSKSAERRPYRLAIADADVAHAQAWDEAATGLFLVRKACIQRMGFNDDDSDDLAERLHLRDVEQDDRRLCLECRHYRPGHCGNHRVAELQGIELPCDLALRLQRCPGFAS